MPRIFMDSVDKSVFYIYVISRNKLARLGKGYSTTHLKYDAIKAEAALRSTNKGHYDDQRNAFPVEPLN